MDRIDSELVARISQVNETMGQTISEMGKAKVAILERTSDLQQVSSGMSQSNSPVPESNGSDFEAGKIEKNLSELSRKIEETQTV